METYLKPPRTTLQPSQNWWKNWCNPRGTFRPPQPSKKLLEPWWNPRGTLPQTTPDHPAALVEPSWNLTSNHPDHPAAWNFGGTLAEPSSNPQPSKKTLPQTTPDHPALAEPGGTLVEPWWNPGGTLVEPWWNPGGTLVEPWWNLSSGSPRTTPEPIWAETPKLSAVGEKKETQNLPQEKRRQAVHSGQR